MINKPRKKIYQFLESSKEYPVLAAVAAGLYPLLYYYYSNYTLLNSSEQVIFFISYFLIIPILCFVVVWYIVNKITYFKPVKKWALPICNFAWMSYLIVLIIKGFHTKYILLVVVIAIGLAIIMRKHFKKIIILQLLLSALVLFPLVNYMVFGIEKPDTWLTQPDAIEDVVFKIKPNIYFIQPDGYANTRELKQGYYKFDNSHFEDYLTANNFKIYQDYRSNYYSTLSSNSSAFGMKHHYHNFPKNKIREVYNARNVIVGNNPVINILKRNNYKTHLLLDNSYLLTNRPIIEYDYCNINLNELSYFSKGFQVSKEIKTDLESLQIDANTSSNFYFLEELSPGHVPNRKSPGDIANIEREKYLSRLQETNDWLKDLLDYINENDPNSLVIIAADHGGFVGMHSTLEARERLDDRNLIYSIFTAQLAIKWPNNLVPEYDDKLKTPVNLFRILFSYLSDNETYLKNLQDDSSYIQIEKGAPFGVYEYIDENGELVFNRVFKD